MIAAIEKAGYGVVTVGAGRHQVRRHRIAHRSRAAARTSSRRHRDDDRRHHRHAAEFRRRARHRRYPAPGRSERARAGAGHARHARPDDHPRPPRQLLRQDDRLQQSQAVRHSLLAHHAPHRGSRFRHLRQGPRTGSPPSAAWCAACAACASAPSARVPRPSTPSATAKSCSKPAASPSSPSISPKSSAASTA